MGMVAAEIVDALSRGERESQNLMEALSVDFIRLLQEVLPVDEGRVPESLKPGFGVTRRMAAAGQVIFDTHGASGLARLVEHRSDTVRGWGAYVVAAIPGLPIGRRIEMVRDLADDRHFNVREWAWLALRPHIALDLEGAIRKLGKWAGESSPNIRRFAVESTRPRGVWCGHIMQLKRQPELGEAILEQVKSDDARYVRLAVGNWINDASKTRPDWADALCGRWAHDSPTRETAFIIRRGLRSKRVPKQNARRLLLNV